MSEIDALPQTIIECFSSTSVYIKSAASHVFGAAVGNLDSYLPLILTEIQTQSERKYLFLHSLKELISLLSQTPKRLQQLLPSVPSIWTKLVKHCEHEEEGVRNVIAECLVKLVLVKPDELLPLLQQNFDDGNQLMKTAVFKSFSDYRREITRINWIAIVQMF